VKGVPLSLLERTTNGPADSRSLYKSRLLRFYPHLALSFLFPSISLDFSTFSIKHILCLQELVVVPVTEVAVADAATIVVADVVAAVNAGVDVVAAANVVDAAAAANVVADAVAAATVVAGAAASIAVVGGVIAAAVVALTAVAGAVVIVAAHAGAAHSAEAPLPLAVVLSAAEVGLLSLVPWLRRRMSQRSV
jgi:hypothetical protein